MRTKYMPYIRRATGKEKADNFRMGIRLAYYIAREKPFYVMVQRGFPNTAMECGRSKRDISQKPALVARGMTFKQWAKVIQKRAE